MSGYEAAFDWAQRQVDSGRIPTAVLGIATRDGVVDIRAFGADDGRVTKPDDLYPLFSVTKPLVALTAIRAVERGLVTLGAPLVARVPERSGLDPAAITLTHLLSHTSGIAEPEMDAVEGPAAHLRTAESDFAAGTMSRYSTLNFQGVRELVEAATGRTLEDELATMLAGVGVSDIAFEPAAEPHRVHNADGFDMERFVGFHHAGAGLFGRAEDLLAIGSSLLADDGRLVTPVGLAASLTSRTDGIPRLAPYTADRGQDWGLGWNLLRRQPGMLVRDAYGHGGWAGAEFWMLPGAGACVVLLTNRVDPQLVLPQLLNAVASGL